MRFEMRMRTTLLLLLAIVLTGQATAQVELAAGDVNASANSIVVVPVILTQADPLVSALQFTLTFPAGSLSVADDPAVFASTADSDHSVLSDSSAGEVSVVIFSSGLQTLASGSRPVAHVVLEVGGGGAGTEIAVDIASAEASGPTGTAIPLVTEGGVVTISSDPNSALPGANRQIFPQIANGTFPGGVFSVSLVFVNRTGVEAEARISFFKSDANPFELSLASGDSGTSFEFTVPASGSAFLSTDGTGDLATGYAILDSNVPLGGSLVFSWDSGTAILTEAGVGASPVGTTFSIPLLFDPGVANTGLALANFGAGAADVGFVLKDPSGGQVATDERSFGAGTHVSIFGNELFPTLSSGGVFEGSIEITSSVAISVITLKQLGSGLLTTLPVVVPVN